MEEYMAEQIISGGLNYTELFAIEKWKTYQSNVDQLLKDKGNEKLIVNQEA